MPIEGDDRTEVPRSPSDPAVPSATRIPREVERRLAREILEDLVRASGTPADASSPLGGDRTGRPGTAADGVGGRYVVREELGRGGMGVVYRAHDSTLGRDVALKVLLLADRADGALLDRFQREARTAAALDHPHIIRVLDVGILPSTTGSGPGHPFYTMELLEGEDLASAIQAKRLVVRDLVEVGRQIAQALAYAHQRGVLHRDVKPNNVFLRRSPELAPPPEPADRLDRSRDAADPIASAPNVATVVAGDRSGADAPPAEAIGVHALLLDFGLAKLIESDFDRDTPGERSSRELTRSGQLLGTPVYMSPEQARGSREVDGRADVYGLGATLYHGLTGHPPFQAAALADLLEAVQYHDPTPPRRLRPDLDPDLETLVMKCLAKEPQQRYPTAFELGEEARRFLAGEPLSARPVGPVGRLWRRARRHPRIAALTGGFVAALFAASALLLHFAVVPRFQRAREARQVAAEREARAREAAERLRQARAALEAGNRDLAREMARTLILTCRLHRAPGEDLPVGEAHLLLARIARDSGDARGALAECYRAFEAAVGTELAAERLLDLGTQLLDMGEYERAQGCFHRALESSDEPRSQFVARRGLIRSLASLGRYAEAAAWIPSLAESPAANSEERLEVDRLGRFLSLLTPALDVEETMMEFAFVDADGDRRCELVALSADGRAVLLRPLRENSRPIASLAVLTDEPYPLSNLLVLDVTGDGRPEIVVSGGIPGAGPNAGRGMVAILDVRASGLSVLARGELPCHTEGPSFAALDFDGDGRREFFVGLSYYDRSIRVFRLDSVGGRLVLEDVWRMPGDVLGLFPRDADGDGVPELWVLLGPWQGYELICFEHDPTVATPVLRSRTKLGREYRVEASGSDSRARDFLLALTWSRESYEPLVALRGKEEVERTYRRPGVYQVTLGSDLHPVLDPVWEHTWNLAGRVYTWGATLTDGVERFTWAGIHQIPIGSDLDGFEMSPGRVFVREGSGWTRLLEGFVPTRLPTGPRAFDLDGDGDTELVLPEGAQTRNSGRIGRIRVLGLDRGPTRAAATPSFPHDASRAGRSLPRRALPAALTAARMAEWLGLSAEARQAYARATEAALAREDFEEAAFGLTRMLVSTGAHEEAARTARELGRRYPEVQAALARVALDALEAAGDWTRALDAALELQGSPTVAPADLPGLVDRIRALRELVEVRPVLFLGGSDLTNGDLLATSPFFVQEAFPGGIQVAVDSSSEEGLFIPMAQTGASYRLRGRIEIVQHDWETSLETGLFSGEPWAAPFARGTYGTEGEDFPRVPQFHLFHLLATGDSHSPLRRWLVSTQGTGTRGSLDVDSGSVGRWLGSPFELQYSRRAEQIGFRFDHDDGDGRVTQWVKAPPLIDQRVWWTVLGRGNAGVTDHWGVFRLVDLALECGSSGMKPMRVQPVRGIEHLYLANGRWCQGRREEARGLYDKAVELCSLEREHEEARKARGLPSPEDAAWAARHLRWAPVDARLWRGLIRAESGEAEGAREDLDWAVRHGLPRVRARLAAAARSLARLPRARVLLCDILREIQPPEVAADPVRLAGALLRDFGGEAAEALTAHLPARVLRFLRVQKVQEEGPPGPVRAGDLLVSYDGRSFPNVGAFRWHQARLRDRGATGVPVLVWREGVEVPGVLDPLRTVLFAEDLVVVGQD